MTLGLLSFTAMGLVEPKDFISICLMVFTFYFSNKGTENNNYLVK